MAGAGLSPGQLEYRELCGLYFLREQIQADRRKEMALAIRSGVASILGAE